MNKKTIVIVGLTAVLLLGAVAVASINTGGSTDAAASATPPGFDLVKSRFQVPHEMTASARGGQVFAPASVPGYAILKFDWARSNGSSKGACVSVDSGNRSEAGPYCFTARQLSDCNALISLPRSVGDYMTFGLIRPSVNSVTVQPKDGMSKHVPASSGLFYTLTEKQVESCRL
jgi:hypothetical protein